VKCRWCETTTTVLWTSYELRGGPSGTRTEGKRAKKESVDHPQLARSLDPSSPLTALLIPPDALRLLRLSLSPPLLKPAPPRRAISFISTPVRLFVSRHLSALDRHRSPRRTAHSANEGSDPSRVERRERIARNPSKAMVRSTTASYGKYRSTAHSLVEISPYDLDPFKISYTVFTVPSSQQLAGQRQVKVSLSKTATRQIVIIIVIAATRLARAATTEGKLHRLPAFTSVPLGSGGDHASRTLSCPRSLLFRSVRVALSAQRLPTKIRKLVDVARRDLILMRRHGLA
jgi:hypothetical protein